jgi:hypothetical protein
MLPGCTDICGKVSNDMLPSWFNYTASYWDGVVDNVIKTWPSKYSTYK